MHLAELKIAMRAAYAASLDVGHDITWLPNAYPVVPLRHGTLEGFIFHNPTHVIVAFQGTEREVGDIRADLDFKKIRFPGIPGKWHRGFIVGAGQFFMDIHSWLRTERKGRKLIITGFSLGAALAQALSVHLHYTRVDHTVFSFGGPRIANYRAARWLNSKKNHSRIVTHDDPVPHLPPFFLGFKHVGELGVWTPWGGLDVRPRAWMQTYFGRKHRRHGHNVVRYALLAATL